MKILTLLICLLSFSFFANAQIDEKNKEEIQELNKLKPRVDTIVEMSRAKAFENYSLYNISFTVASNRITNEEGKTCYLVRKAGGTKWQEVEEIKYLDYQDGYEYEIKCDQVDYRDPSKKDEYVLLRVYSKEKKESDVRKQTERPPFKDIMWETTEFSGEEVNRGYIRFYDDNRAAASAGCNSFTGIIFKVDESQKTIRFMASKQGVYHTEKWCSDKKMMQREDKLYPLLLSINSYELKGDMLMLKKGKKIIMRLKR